MTHTLLPFERKLLDGPTPITRIGNGPLGGKAEGLVRIRETLETAFPPSRFPNFEVALPTSVVLTTEVFEAFLQRNQLYDIARSDRSDQRIAQAFQGADLPTEILGDLRALTSQLDGTPLAVRSSSQLEDDLLRPFAGVYGTKMVPNHQPDPDQRFQKLVEAIKFVYASTFFRTAKDYLRTVETSQAHDSMAVLIQTVVGRRYGERFYPQISGVLRSFNYYPNERCRPEDGVANLALGLGKTIVDGDLCWTYTPKYPNLPPPFGSTRDWLRGTQTRFWAVHMGAPPDYNPIAEDEHLSRSHLEAADYDGILAPLASTYLADSDRILPGINASGTRILDFAPLLRYGEFPLNDIFLEILAASEALLGSAVEIELAANLPQAGGRGNLGFLQVRPMVIPAEAVDLQPADLLPPNLLLSSNRVMGNGCRQDILDVVYVRPDTFEARHTRALARLIEERNSTLQSQGRPYLLIGFGRWGSSDPWLGIPVQWSQVSGAKAIVEATLPDMNVELSQGSHFFHNLASFGVSYFCIHHTQKPGINWDWLASQPTVTQTEGLRHVQLKQPLDLRVDGRSGRGAIHHGGSHL